MFATWQHCTSIVEHQQGKCIAVAAIVITPLHVCFVLLDGIFLFQCSWAVWPAFGLRPGQM
jgi:hypothetical protein